MIRSTLIISLIIIYAIVDWRWSSVIMHHLRREVITEGCIGLCMYSIMTLLCLLYSQPVQHGVISVKSYSIWLNCCLYNSLMTVWNADCSFTTIYHGLATNLAGSACLYHQLDARVSHSSQSSPYTGQSTQLVCTGGERILSSTIIHTINYKNI